MKCIYKIESNLHKQNVISSDTLVFRHGLGVFGFFIQNSVAFGGDFNLVQVD